MRRSAVLAQVAGGARSARAAAMRASASRANDLDGGVVADVAAPSRSVAEEPLQTLVGTGDRPAASSAASRHSPSAACSPPAGGAVPARGGLERGPRGPGRPRQARSTRPRCTRASAASRTSPVASAFSIASSRVAAPVCVVAGLALCPAQAGQLVGLGLQEAELARGLAPRGRCARRRRRTGAGGGPARRASPRRARAATGRRPSRSQRSTWSRGLDGAVLVAGGDRRPRGEQPVRGLVPRAGPAAA